MEGNIVGEPFDEFVAKQINVRQKAQFGGYNTSRTNDQLQYLNNRNAWVKLASSVEIGIDSLGDSAVSPKLDNIGLNFSYAGTKLAEKAILFNTLSSYTNSSSPLNSTRAGISDVNTLWNDTFAYGIGGTEFGIQPPPGIINVQVDSLNRGSIRKANITLKAHNRFQFDIIELLYLRLGFTMMLEWGWDRYIDNDTGKIEPIRNTIIEDTWFIAKDKSQLEMLGYIQAKRNNYDGNYDGFFGKVSNFSWNFNPDGSYDITIDLITVGDVIESIKANTFAKGSFFSPDATEEQLEDQAKKVSLSPDNIILKAASVNAIVEYLYDKIILLNNSTNLLPGEVGQGRGILRNNILEYFELSTPSVNGKSVGSQYYVRLGEFLSQLEGLIVPRVENGTSKTPQLTINYTTENNLISFFPNQISLDPKVCIFRPFISYGDINGVIFPYYLSDLELYAKIISLPSNGKIQTFGYLMNMYINIEYIAGLVTSNGSPSQDLPILKLLQDLCNGINDALGGVNKLEPVIKNDNIVTLIDQTLISPEEDIVELEIYGYNPSKLDSNGKSSPVSNFVKSLEFVSKITPQLASMISIGATAAGSNTSEIDGTAFSKWSDGLVDRFSQKIVEPKLEDPKTAISADKAALQREFDNDFEKVNAVSRFFRNLFGGNVTADQRIVNNPKYGAINGQPMSFEKFFTLASEILNNDIKNGIWYEEELPTLVSKNYGVYLVEAFGGKLDSVKIYSSTSPKPIYFERSAKQGRYAHFNDTFIDQGKGAYKNYINSLNNERYNTDRIPSSEIGFIPLSFELTLEGISGIKIYNKLSINNKFLPTNYPESLNFVITKVNHQISNNNWDTSLSTISMPKTEPYNYSKNAGDSGQDNSTGDNIQQGTGNFDPGNLFTSNRVTTNAWKLTSDPTIPVENGFLHRYPGMLVEADTNLYKRLDMQNSSDNKKFRLFYPAMPYFINLLNAYEKAISADGQTFLQKYGKLTITSAYRAIQNTPGGGAAAAPGTSRHGLGLAIDLQQPASHAEVYDWFKVNAPGLGWMRIPLLNNGTNETWHWELQYEGPYAKIDKNVYATTSNIQNNGRNGSAQYSSSKFKEAKGVEKISTKYLIDATGKVWGKQITAQTLPPI